MKVKGSFGHVDTPPVITEAILIYEGDDKAAATLNKVALDEQDRPFMGPGLPCTHADFKRIVDTVYGQSAGQMKRPLLPENLLVGDSDLMMWWTPSSRRRLFFETSDKTFNADVNGHEVLQPALLFMALAKGGLYICALGESKRPDLATTLWRAPYFNIYDNGHMCQGTYRFPEVCRATEIRRWEKGFFDTHFSHTNVDQQRLTTHPHGHNALWREMSKTRLKQ